MLTRRIFLECSGNFSQIHLPMGYIVVKYQPPNYNICQDMNYFLVTFGQVQTPDARRQTDRQKAAHMSHRANCTGGLKKQHSLR